MALTKNSKQILRRYDPEMKKVRYNVTFDSSYLTGGEELDCTGDFSEIDEVRIEAGGGYLIEPNPATKVAKYGTGKVDLMCYRQTAATSALIEVASAVNLSALVVDVIVEGRP
jgi:hypothetical protein